MRRTVFCKVPRQCFKSGIEDVNSFLTLDFAVWKATWVKRLFTTPRRLHSLILCSFFQPADSPYLYLLHCLSWGSRVKKRSNAFSSLLHPGDRDRTLNRESKPSSALCMVSSLCCNLGHLSSGELNISFSQYTNYILISSVIFPCVEMNQLLLSSQAFKF